MNAALERSGSGVTFKLVFGDSKSNPAFAQSEALRLINQEQVKALVTDSSGVTVAINRLNYDPGSPAKQKVPITCFQCSSSFIQAPEMTSAGAYEATATLMLAALVAAGDPQRPRQVSSGQLRDGLAKINHQDGREVRPTIEDFGAAIAAIAKGQPINYEGAYDSDDWDSVGGMFPALVHWKVENGQFVEYELYGCSPSQALCPSK
jgi:hypothetical protein